MIPSDTELISRSVSGDQDALTELLERYGPLVRAGLKGQIQTHLQSLLTEDDVMQETYVDAFLDIAKFKPQGEGAFTAWLTTLARRNLIDAIRLLESQKRGGDRRRVETRSEDDSCVALFDYLSGTKTSPSGSAARKEAKSCLLRALGSLPPAYQQVVRMYDLGGKALQEVATAIGRSPGAVLMLRARAHKQLSVQMGTASHYLSTDT